MRRLLLLALAAALPVSGFALAGGAAPLSLSARLDARHETPAPKSAARAGGVFTATLAGRTLTWRLTFARLSGRAAAAHVHLGKAGIAGPVAVPLCGPCASGAHGRVTVTAKVRAALLGGGAYVNVHTAKNPAGEIRGQVVGPRAAAPAPAPATTTTTSGGYGY